MIAAIGAVLCGGASRRMGVDKATLTVDGVAMARRAANTLIAAGCSPVVAIGGDEHQLRGLGLEYVDDEFPGEGPLGGILTALGLGSPVVVVACDLPNIQSTTITAMVIALGDHHVAMAQSNRAEPLCAVWADRVVPLLQSRFRSGERAMHRAIEGLDIAWVTVPVAEVRNINTPSDLGNL
jgi:molybdopterin-guanine dinucleotide biosynthesis protein A